MKVKDIEPVVNDFTVIIDDLKYKETICSIRVTCHCSSLADARNNIFTPLYASCEEPYFVMGQNFWEENFGKKQSNRIKKLCNEAIKDFLDKDGKDNNDKKIAKELYKILEWCEKGKEYHQAIVELKIKILEGSL